LSSSLTLGVSLTHGIDVHRKAWRDFLLSFS
jgi:hypothetical protein